MLLAFRVNLGLSARVELNVAHTAVMEEAWVYQTLSRSVVPENEELHRYGDFNAAANNESYPLRPREPPKGLRKRWQKHMAAASRNSW